MVRIVEAAGDLSVIRKVCWDSVFVSSYRSFFGCACSKSPTFGVYKVRAVAFGSTIGVTIEDGRAILRTHKIFQGDHIMAFRFHPCPSGLSETLTLAYMRSLELLGWTRDAVGVSWPRSPVHARSSLAIATVTPYIAP